MSEEVKTAAAAAEGDNGEEVVDGDVVAPDDGAPVECTLPEIEVLTGEEEEHVLWEKRVKLYRDSNSEWKERGNGIAKILKHSGSGRVRFLMRREGTLKVCSNHALVPGMVIKAMVGSEKAFVWATVADYSDGEAKSEVFAIRLPTVDDAKLFHSVFTEAVSGEESAEPSKAPAADAASSSAEKPAKEEEETRDPSAPPKA